MKTSWKLLLVMVVTLTLIVPAALRAAEPDYKTLYEEQKKRNDELEKRLGLVEEHLKTEPYIATADVPEPTLKFLKEIEISGYVSSSYFYNINHPSDRINTGRGFDVKANEFMFNKFLMKMTKPVEYDAFEWRAGFTVETIFGQDAEFTQAAGLSLGDQGDLTQAYFELNIPVGNGLKVAVGKYSTPIGYELLETELNSNWSGGNQWTLIEPFTHTGVFLSYKPFTTIEANLYMNNGWDNVADNNNAKSFIGRLAYTPNDATSLTIIGFGGPEQDDNTGNWRYGVDFVATRTLSPKFSVASQLDFGAEQGADINGEIAQWYAGGLWLIYNATEKCTVALRGDYLNDCDGVRTSDAPSLAPFDPNTGQELTSVTLTINFKPLEALRISPEIRWDHSSWSDAFHGANNQFTLGMGGAFFF